jgi:lipid-A-disaccharide synthase
VNEVPPLIFIIAGEQSGDLLGGRLMAALRERTSNNISFAGIGGEKMMAEKLDPLFPMSELSVMGLIEVVPRIPQLLKRIRQSVDAVARLRPAALVTIDAPDFSFRVARRVHALGIPCIHYVAPTVWAWRPGRAKMVAQFLDHLLALLPFEPPYFETVSLPCTFVGHPAIEGGAGKGDGAAFRHRHAVPAHRPIVAMLPGSRPGEVERLLPIFVAALQRLQGKHSFVAAVPVVPAVAHYVRAGLAGSGLDAILVEGEADKFDAFAAAQAALAKSGTGTLELALCSVPSVIAYRVNALSYAIARRMGRVRFIGLPNIILDRALMPELLQDDCRPDRLAVELARLFDDPEARGVQIEGAGEVRRLLSGPAGSPSVAAADIVLEMIGKRSIP